MLTRDKDISLNHEFLTWAQQAVKNLPKPKDIMVNEISTTPLRPVDESSLSYVIVSKCNFEMA